MRRRITKERGGKRSSMAWGGIVLGCATLLGTLCSGNGLASATRFLPLLSTLLLTGLLLVAIRKNEEIEALVEETSRALSREVAERNRVEETLRGAHDELEGLVRERTSELRSSETALRECARKWQTTFDAMSDGIAILDLSGKVLQCNKAMLDLLRVPPDQVLGSPCCDLVHGFPEQGCPFRRMKQTARRNTLVCEFRGLWINIVVEPIFGVTGELAGAVHILSDISGPKRTEHELLRVNRALKTLSACNRALVYAQDERSLLVEICRNLVQNGGFRFAWVGYAPDSDPGAVRPVAHAGNEEGYLDTITGPSSRPGESLCTAAIRSGAPCIATDTAADTGFAPWREDALRRGYLSAAAFPLATEGKTFGALAIYATQKDAFNADERELLQELATNLSYGITALRTREKGKAAEAALRESVERYRTLVENLNVGVSLVDHDLTIVAINTFFSEIFEKPPEELIGSKCFHKHPANEPCPDCPGKAAMSLGKQCTVERELLSGDGIPRLFRVSAFPVLDDDGNASRFIEIIEDITAHRQAEQEKSHLELQLRHSQKMEALGTLAGGIAHDFNNILTAINGYSSLIWHKTLEGDPVRQYLNKLMASTERAASLTGSLLAYSRKQPLNPQPVDLNQVIIKVGILLSRLLGEDINLTLVPAEGPSTVMADAHQLEQVLVNLATNARDAMPSGGVLEIAIDRVELDRGFIKAHGYGTLGRFALVTVSDTGCGMDPETRNRIFEPFFTTKEVGKGTGLGLSIVYGIVKQHRGFINAYSTPGKGTTFTIYLPLTPGPAPQDQQAPLPSPAGGTETILFVEDDPDIRSSITVLLEEEGYRVIAAVDGAEGVQRFQENREEVALVIMDMVMPRLNGRAAYEKIQQIRPGVKAIFLSGYTPDVLNARGVLQPKVNFITKPIAMNKLLLQIREVLET